MWKTYVLECNHADGVFLTPRYPRSALRSAPIKYEIYDAGGSGTWEVREDFAVATWVWTDEGFKVKGLKY